MGWKGTLRAVNSELKRQSREADKHHRQQLKEIEREEAFEDVQDQERFLQEIISLHHECRACLDWRAIESQSEPKRPKHKQPLTNEANEKLGNFKPNFIEKILRIQNWRKKKLENNVHKARLADEQNYTEALEEFKLRKRNWEKKQDLAKRLKTDKNAVLEALQEYLDIEDLPVDMNVQFEVSDEMQIDVNLKVLPYEDVIPDEVYSLRQSGTLSTKKMPIGKGLELYQDHVCSALLRIARETLGVVPLETVRANAVVNAINTQTGHLEDQIIISIIVVRDTFSKLNMRKIDPSDALSNFVYNMQFKKTKGFEKVDKITLS